MGVRILIEKLVINNPLIESAPDRKRIPDDCPLRLTIKAKHLAKIVHEPSQHKPVLVTTGANGLRRLQQMLKLIQLDIRIRVVDERVQKLKRLEDAHLPMVEAQKLPSLARNKVECLLAMILPIEFPHRLASRTVVIAIAFARLHARLRIHLLLNELLPRMKPILLTRIGVRTVHRLTRSQSDDS